MYTTLWIIIALQIFMGALDTLLHHEFLEKLAWRKSQASELKLHALRNLFYAVIFLGLGTLQPGGLWAFAVIILLGFEFLITLRDFAEEDMTRKLPISERLLHTIITANYGIVLALLIPVLWGWAQNPTGLEFTSYGVWTGLMAISAIAVFILAIRDFHASNRLGRLIERKLSALIPKGDKPQTILITGGTGFIGRRLIPALQSAGHNVIVITRNAAKANLPAPITLIESFDHIAAHQHIDIVINLAGESLSNGLWTAKKRKAIRDSRIGLTQDLLAMLTRLDQKPDLLINGSAIGVYGVHPQGPQDEDSEIQIDGTFSQELCLDWEAQAYKAQGLGLRVACLRIGMVLDRDGAALQQILIPTELGGGAKFGNGKQMMSWISRDDLVGMIGHIIANPSLSGPINGVSPLPITNAAFTKAVASALYRPSLVSIPKLIMNALGGLGREILMADHSIHPKAALESGYAFMDTDIDIFMKAHLRGVKTAKEHSLDLSKPVSDMAG
ncbi:MAG: TIGR01777 family oxidoreductase [Hellea sp.]